MASFKTVYTTKGENPAAIINELSKIEEEVVKLYLPQHAVFFEDRSNFELLKREADFLGKEVIIVTLDKDGRGLAAAAGFSTQVPDAKEGGAEAESAAASTEEPPAKGKTLIRRFVDISGGPKRPLSEMEPVKPEETVSLDELEKETLAGAAPVAAAPSLTPPAAADEEEREAELSTFLHDHDKYKEAMKNLPTRARLGWLSGRSRWVAAGLAIIILLYLAVAVLPKAAIVVSSARQPVNFEATIVIDKNLAKVNREAARLPGQILEISKTLSQNYPATGTRGSAGKVQGTITAYNEQLSAQAMIPSRFQAESNGKIYRSQKNIVIPAATKQGDNLTPGKLDIAVVADEAGEGPTLECSAATPCRFTVPAWQGTDKFTKVYALATAALTGGSTADAKVITADDFKSGQAALTDALKQAAQEELTKSLATGLRLIPESLALNTGDIEADKTVGAAADSFTLSATASAKAVAVSDEDIKTFVDETVQSRLPPDKRTYRDTVAVTFNDAVVNIEKGEVQVALSAKEEVGWQLSPAALKRQLKGKSRDQVQALVTSDEKIAKIKVDLWPFWVSSVPNNEGRLNITAE